MLAPDTRVLLGDALRPPEAHQLDVAVGTTYSLDLTALLLAPMSFAFVEPGEDLARTDPASLLAAVRRYSERTTVFCQAGSIAVPGAYRRVLTFVEGSVHEVTAPTKGRVFHPKVWALRFVDRDGAYLHRLVVLSRNLTFDRSWDTALVLDEEPDASGVDTAPIVDFLRALPGLAVRSLPEERLDQVESLARTIATATLSPPSPFDALELLPLGLGGPGWPLPATVDRALVLSPCLDVGAVTRVARTTANRILVSRPETFARLGGAALGGWQTRTLSRLAEGADQTELDPEPGPDGAAPGQGWGRVPDGLHAKVVVADVGSRGHLVTGSANLTTAGWEGNVEFGVHLSGPVARCGVGAVLGKNDDDGLGRLMEPFAVTDPDAAVDPREATERELDLFHQTLAAGVVQVEVSEGSADDVVTLTARMSAADDGPGRTQVWPITLRRDAHAQPVARGVTWPDVSLGVVTPFLAVETTAGTGPEKVTRRCVLRAELVGDPPGRHQQAVQEILSSMDAVVRYLSLLLADPTLGASAATSALVGPVGRDGEGHGWSVHDVVLFEPLIRAAVRDRAGVERIAGMVEELRGGGGLLPDGFEELWAVVREVVMDGVQE